MPKLKVEKTKKTDDSNFVNDSPFNPEEDLHDIKAEAGIDNARISTTDSANDDKNSDFNAKKAVSRYNKDDFIFKNIPPIKIISDTELETEKGKAVIAIRTGDMDKFLELVKKNSLDKEGELIQEAALNGRAEMFEYLYKNGSDKFVETYENKGKDGLKIKFKF